MSTLQDRPASAIQLRESENHEEAHQILLALHAEFPEDPQVNYGSKLPCAWIHNLLGLEKEAIPFYEKAVQTGLRGNDLKSAQLGMGSTDRCLGEYQKSIETYQRAIRFYSDKLDQTW